tara:strand:+ start:208 stop:666 length:459 start_codon:yes stop_codon:yes gene_type:complete
MSHNFLEKLRFNITIENLTSADQSSPVLYLGVNELYKDRQIELSPEINELYIEGSIPDAGAQKLILEVKETNEAWRIGGFKIKELKVHGIGVGKNLFQCVYFPKYDNEFYEENKTRLSREIKGGLHIGNRGRWEWKFDSPIHNNALYKIGLW